MRKTRTRHDEPDLPPTSDLRPPRSGRARPPGGTLFSRPAFLRRPGRDLSSCRRFVLSSCGRERGEVLPPSPCASTKGPQDNRTKGSRPSFLRQTGRDLSSLGRFVLSSPPPAFGTRGTISRRLVSSSSRRPREAPGSFLTRSSRSPRSVRSGMVPVPGGYVVDELCFLELKKRNLTHE